MFHDKVSIINEKLGNVSICSLENVSFRILIAKLIDGKFQDIVAAQNSINLLLSNMSELGS